LRVTDSVRQIDTGQLVQGDRTICPGKECPGFKITRVNVRFRIGVGIQGLRWVIMVIF